MSEGPARLRVTLRAEGTEIRGYATQEALYALAEAAVDQLTVVASPADDDYDPWANPTPDPAPETLDTLQAALLDVNRLILGVMQDQRESLNFDSLADLAAAMRWITRAWEGAEYLRPNYSGSDDKPD